ncbi:MAG TPA: hypothetical protein VKW06_22740 [Candidatus Angelobacter sp.]|nr:hypothetical protein [Candidatus Angelobacter sp.]
MSQAFSLERTHTVPNVDALFRLGRPIFAAAIMAFGVETLVCARWATHSLGPRYNVIPVLPWLPAIPCVAYLFGLVWIACGAGLLVQRWARLSALTLGTLLFVCTIVLEVPKNAANIGSVPLRTMVFEPLALACLAWLMPALGSIPPLLERYSRYLLAIAFLAFGVDHFLALQFIADLIPNWVPWHTFWVAFFGVVFIAAAASFVLNFLVRWAAAGAGLMFAIWVVTLHVPWVMGVFAFPQARPNNPNGWSSLFIAIALWGGLWALARDRQATEKN